jgi:hypothetical protein
MVEPGLIAAGDFVEIEERSRAAVAAIEKKFD